MRRLTLSIDGRVIRATAGTSLLRAALEAGIYIPNLCMLQVDTEPEASCRLCFVEIEGWAGPVPACTVTVARGMVVQTRSPRVLKLVRAGFELVMTAHQPDCARCAANRACELQKIANHLRTRLRPRRWPKVLNHYPLDESHPLYRFEPDKCVLCGRCVRTGREIGAAGMLGFAHRGFRRRVTTFGEAPLGPDLGPEFEACVRVCPTGALSLRGKSKKIKETQSLSLISPSPDCRGRGQGIGSPQKQTRLKVVVPAVP